MRDTDFAFSVAYMRTMENKMLNQGDVDALASMGDVGEALKYLEDRNYGGGDRAGGRDKKEIDALVKAEMEKAWREVREACPKGAPIDVLLYQNDFQNLKAILKAVFSGSSWQGLMLYPCIAEPELIHRAVSENGYDELPVLLKKPAEDAYAELAEHSDGQRAEIILDQACFAAMERAADKAKNKFLKDWVELWAELANMKTALRAALEKKEKAFVGRALLPMKRLDADSMAEASAQGVSAVADWLAANGLPDAAEAAGKSISEFEKWCDNRLMDFIRSVQNNTFGFEPLVAFLYGKKAEGQAVRIVLYGLMNRIPKNILKERLRDMYV